MKKRLVAILCLLVFLCGHGNFAVTAANTADLLNGEGDFENGMAAWQAISQNTGWDSYCFIETTAQNIEAVRNGEAGLKITAENSTVKPWVYRSSLPLTEGATYTVEGYIKGYFESAGFKTETTGNGVSEGKETKYQGSTNGQWVKLTHTFTVPKGANRAKVYCRLYSAGTVYFDDVTMYMSKAPEPLSFSTSDVFHYEDDTRGTAQVFLHSFYLLEEYEDVEITFEIKEKMSGRIITQKIENFYAHTVTFTYDPRMLSIRTPGQSDPPEYTLSIYVYNFESLETLDSYTQALYRYNRPSMLGKDGYVRIDDKIIDPVIAYHVNNTADYSYMDDIGVSVVQVPYWYTSRGEATKREALLAALDAKGLKALFCLYRNSKMPNHPDNYENTKYVVDALKNDKRVFAFALMDEPLGAGVTDEKLADLEECYKMIRDIDSMHPIYFVDYTSSNFSYDIKYCDVFAVDPYNYSLTGVVDATKEAVRVADGEKPVYTIVGAFQTTTGLFPAPDLVRHMTYQALVHGAKGFGYFAFEDSISKKVSETGENIPLYRTSLWEPMCAYAKTDMKLAFENLVHRDGTISISGGIAEKSWVENGETYRFIMSMHDETITRTYPTAVAEVEIIYGTNAENVVVTERAQQRVLQVTVQSGAVMLLREKRVTIKPVAENTFEVMYYGENADLYVGVYDEEEKELLTFAVKKNINEALVVTVPENTEYCMKVFVFSSGTLKPLMKKQACEKRGKYKTASLEHV